jgi:N-acetylglucosaminyl-diphospho-decaprenol L-rhamnosyltransferase
MTTIDIVIVNWNSGQLLSRALASIESAQPANASVEVVVVDNHSTDDPFDGAALARSGVRVITNSTNRGFAAACNQGAKVGSGEFILLMNPDVEVSTNSLAIPLAFLQCDTENRYAICGIRLLDVSGRPTGTCARFPTPARYMAWTLGLDRMFPFIFSPHLMTATELAHGRNVDQVIGAFFFVRRSVFEQLGGLDERFFMYFEEVDFSYRAVKRG